MKMFVLIFTIVFLPLSAGAETGTKLKEMLSSADPEIRSEACLLLAEAGSEAAKELAPCLKDSTMLVRHCAAYSLARIGGPEVEKIFRDGLVSGNYDVRRVSALGLGMMRKNGISEVLGPLLRDDNWEVRWAAVYALGRSNDRRTLALLGPLAAGDSYFDPVQQGYPVREAARQAMKRLNGLIGWETDPERAFALARAEGKPMFLYFRQGGSDLCSQFERTVFTDEKIIDVMQRDVCLWLDSGSRPGIFERFGITRVPSLIFLSPQGRETGRNEGVILSPALLEKMLSFLEKDKSVSSLISRLKKNGRDSEAAWQLAGLCLDEGSWKKAEEAIGLLVANDPYNLSSLLDNALFARAYIQGKLGEYERSRAGCRKLLDDFPSFGDRAQAIYCWGLSALKAGRIEEGKEAFLMLETEYPESDLASAARKILMALD